MTINSEDYSLLFKYLQYNKYTGQLYLLDSSSSIIKEIIPDIFYYVQFSIKDNYNIYKYKLKYSNLIWLLIYNHRPTAKEKILHKDLDLSNFKLNNLVLVSSSTFFSIKEALQNLQGRLRIIQNPRDRLSYILEYKHRGRLFKEVLGDIGIAKKKMLRLQLKYMKFISSYIYCS